MELLHTARSLALRPCRPAAAAGPHPSESSLFPVTQQRGRFSSPRRFSASLQARGPWRSHALGPLSESNSHGRKKENIAERLLYTKQGLIYTCISIVSFNPLTSVL